MESAIITIAIMTTARYREISTDPDPWNMFRVVSPQIFISCYGIPIINVNKRFTLNVAQIFFLIINRGCWPKESENN